jgi:hypothetical protein
MGRTLLGLALVAGIAYAGTGVGLYSAIAFAATVFGLWGVLVEPRASGEEPDPASFAATGADFAEGALAGAVGGLLGSSYPDMAPIVSLPDIPPLPSLGDDICWHGHLGGDFGSSGWSLF